MASGLTFTVHPLSASWVVAIYTFSLTRRHHLACGSSLATMLRSPLASVLDFHCLQCIRRHILPFSALGCSNGLTVKARDESFSLSRTSKGIFIYLHGTSGDRTLNHRVELYRLLQREDYHVVTFDYRGFGDSSGSLPSESDAVWDSMAVYDWVCSHLKCSKTPVPVYIWGHSLGAG